MTKKTIKRKRRPTNKRKKQVVDSIPLSELKGIISQIKSGAPVNAEDIDKLDAAVDTLAVVTGELEQKRVSVARLRRLLFGDTTEKMSNLFPETSSSKGDDSAEQSPSSDNETSLDEKKSSNDTKENDNPKADKKKQKGHGRNPARKYTGADKQIHGHESLQHKGDCPEKGCDGKLYVQKAPKRLVRVTGMAPLKAVVHELERLRCNLCGKIFTAKSPAGVGDETYDNRARAMIAMLKYGLGTPFYRLEKLEGNLGIPLPTSTQWDEVHKLATPMIPIYTELIELAANGKLLYNDDTVAKILNLESPPKIGKNGKERTGVYTSGIVGISNGQQIALFFTGRNHAGNNLEEVLSRRRHDLPPPIQMSDGLPVNTTGDFETIEANCNSHARRKYVEVKDAYPQEVKHILTTYKNVYKNDKATRGMTDDDRLSYHITHSKPLLDDLWDWFYQQIEVEKNIEPNSSLGVAIGYMQERWQKLTLFLKVPGAPLDNNICERIIKRAILHRKNALFFKTENGARVADMFMTIIHTSELNDVNGFEYMVAIAENFEAVAQSPQNWLPWNFQLNLEK